MAENDSENPLVYHNIKSIDYIDVDIIPEKKGLFIKHVEYVVTSKVELLYIYVSNSKRFYFCLSLPFIHFFLEVFFSSIPKIQ